MGSIARMRRAERFIAEFGADFQKQGLSPGGKLEVVDTFLAQEDGNLEQVRIYCTLKDEQGFVHLLTSEGSPFDPESDRGEDLVQRVAENLGIPEEKARERLKKCNLL